MKKIVLGIGLEIAAFAVLLFSEWLNLPLTFALFLHLNGVFFFTKGFDPSLVAINLRRELCFFFSFIFPLAGMAGILFYILVLKRIEHRIVLPAAVVRTPLGEPVVQRDKASMLHEEDFSDLSSAYVRKAPQSVLCDSSLTDPDYCLEEEYSSQQEEWAKKIKELEMLVLEHPQDEEEKQRFARALVEYVCLFQCEPRLTEFYLERAFGLYKGFHAAVPKDAEILEKIVEILFLKKNYRECIKYGEQLRRIDNNNPVAILRMAESLYRLKEYKKLSLLARQVASRSTINEAVKQMAEMWYRYA